MSSTLDRQGLESVEQSIRKRIRQNQCRIRCELPFQSQAGFASSSTVGTDSSGGKAVTGGSSSTGNVDTLDVITINATNGCFQNLKSSQFTTDNASIGTALIQQVSIAQVNGNTNYNGSIMSNVNIDSGTIDNTIIGADNPADGTFTDLQGNNSFTLLGSSGNECITYSAETETFYICGKLVVGASSSDGFSRIDDTIIGGITSSIGIFTDLQVKDNFTLLGSSGEECVTYSAETETFTICGNLVVQGNSTTIQSETIVVEDVTIRLGNTSPLGNDGKDRGMEFGYYDNNNFEMGFMGWDNSNNKFTFLLEASNNNEVYDGTLADIMANTLCINQIQGISGNLTINPSLDLILNPDNDIIIPSEKNLIFGISTSIYNSNNNLIISSNHNILFDISGSLQIPTDKAIEFGSSGYNIYSNNNDLILTSQNNIILDITGSLQIPSDKAIEFGSSGYSIYSDDTDLILTSNGYIVLDSNCLALGSNLDTFLCYENGNIEMITDNIVLNISGSIQVPNNKPIEFGSTDISIFSDNNDLNLRSINDIIFDTNCIVFGITKDCFICKDNGNLQIINDGNTGNIEIITNENLLLDISGSIQVPNNKPIEFGSPGYSIYSDNTDLFLTSNGYVVFDSPGVVFETNDIDVPSFKEYRRISYKDFEIDGDYDVCEVQVKRDLIGGLPIWYFETNPKASGTIIYGYELSQNIRDLNTNGLKLTGVYYWFEILGDNINSISSSVTKSNMNPSIPGIPTLSNVNVDNSILNTNTFVGTYYTKVDIDSNEYYNLHENLTIELVIDKKINSIIKFYGVQLEFDKKLF